MAEIKSGWAVCSVCGKEFEIVGNRVVARLAEKKEAEDSVAREERQDTEP